MDVKAILLVDGHATRFAGGPSALLDVLGRPLLHRTVDTLHAELEADVTVIVEPGMLTEPLPSNVKVVEAQAEMQCHAAERLVEVSAQDAPDAVLLIRMGGYAEIDWQEMLNEFREQRARILRAYSGEDPLEIFCLSPWRRNEAAFLLRNELQKTRSEPARYQTHGYVNSLATPHDLRRLATDALHRRCALQPVGREIRPGIWVGAGARIEKGARLVAPVYIGRRSKVRSGSVVTRSATVEHHSIIDCGTVVENATVLPYSALGPGLDVSHSIVGAKQIFHLKRNAQAVIEDPKLLDELSPSMGIRLLSGLGALMSLLPKTAYEGFRTANKNAPDPQLEAATATSTNNYGATNIYDERKSHNNVTEFPGLAVARDYGNQ